MTKKDNDILARDLVLAAFIVMKRMYESRDAGRAGKLQMFLNVHAGTHGDVKNIVAILNNPKSTVKLSEEQQRIYQRALDIVESLQGAEEGWIKQVFVPIFDTTGIDLDVESKELLRRLNIDAFAPFEIEAIQGMLEKMRANQADLYFENPELSWIKVDLSNMPQEQIEELERLLRFEPSIGKYTLVQDLPEPDKGIGIDNEIVERVESYTLETFASDAPSPPESEQLKAKSGRKAKNPIETAAAKAKKKKESDPCC
jgi:hypothetical protein